MPVEELDVNRERGFHALPWHAWDRGIGYELHVGATCRDEMEPRGYCEGVNNGFRETFCAPEAELIVAAVNALPALLDAAVERDALAAKVERVRELHRAFGIYDECDCDDPDPATHLDVDDVGLTCNLMYRVCAECCRDDVYQTEDCANYHDHRLDEDYHCPTIRALDEENAQSRAPQHPNTYRQPEGNRA